MRIYFVFGCCFCVADGVSVSVLLRRVFFGFVPRCGDTLLLNVFVLPTGFMRRVLAHSVFCLRRVADM